MHVSLLISTHILLRILPLSSRGEIRQGRYHLISSHLVLSRVREATQDKVTSHISFSRSCELARSLRKFPQRSSKVSWFVEATSGAPSPTSELPWRASTGGNSGEANSAVSAQCCPLFQWPRQPGLARCFLHVLNSIHFYIIASLFTGLPMPGLYPCEL